MVKRGGKPRGAMRFVSAFSFQQYFHFGRYDRSKVLFGTGFVFRINVLSERREVLILESSFLNFKSSRFGAFEINF